MLRLVIVILAIAVGLFLGPRIARAADVSGPGAAEFAPPLPSAVPWSSLFEACADDRDRQTQAIASLKAEIAALRARAASCEPKSAEAPRQNATPAREGLLSASQVANVAKAFPERRKFWKAPTRLSRLAALPSPHARYSAEPTARTQKGF